jgi:hypothetical protein
MAHESFLTWWPPWKFLVALLSTAPGSKLSCTWNQQQECGLFIGDVVTLHDLSILLLRRKRKVGRGVGLQ